MINSFIGDDPTLWHSNIPTWGGVRYVDLYPDVDLEIMAQDGNWTWRLVSRQSLSSIRHSNIRLRVEGADTLTVNGNQLHLMTAVGDYTLPLLPVVTPDGAPLDSSSIQPQVKDSEVASPFAFSSAPALIPMAQTTSDLIYGTFLGGNDWDESRAIALSSDGTGNTYVYITGSTLSDDFPTNNPLPGGDIRAGSTDVFVVKLNLNETGADQLVYATYLGGSKGDSAYGIAVDGSGNAYITGSTGSFNFPTQYPYQANLSLMVYTQLMTPLLRNWLPVVIA